MSSGKLLDDAAESTTSHPVGCHQPSRNAVIRGQVSVEGEMLTFTPAGRPWWLALFVDRLAAYGHRDAGGVRWVLGAV